MHLSDLHGGGRSLFPRQFGSTPVCTTEACFNAADMIRKRMNFNVNPCDDFYEYTCGGWMNDTETSYTVSLLSQLASNNAEALFGAINQDFDHFVQTVSKENPEGLSLMVGQEKADRDNFNKVKSFFDSCINEDIINEKGLKPLYFDISDLLHDLNNDINNDPSNDSSNDPSNDPNNNSSNDPNNSSSNDPSNDPNNNPNNIPNNGLCPANVVNVEDTRYETNGEDTPYETNGEDTPYETNGEDLQSETNGEDLQSGTNGEDIQSDKLIPYDGNNILRFTDALIKLHEKGVEAFIKPTVRPRFDNSSQNMLYLYDPPLVLTDDTTVKLSMYENGDTLMEYFQMVYALVKSTMGEPVDDSESEKKRTGDMELFNIPQLTDEQVNEWAINFVRFEQKMTTLIEKDRRAKPGEWTIEEANKNFPVVDWTRYLRHFTPQEQDIITHMTVNIPDNLINIGKWLSNDGTFTVSQSDLEGENRPPTYDDIIKYLVVKLIITKAPNLPDPVNSDSQRIINLAKGSSRVSPRSLTCYLQTTEAFKDILSRFFSILKFGGEEQRMKANKLVSNLLDSWRENVNQDDWIDDETLQSLLYKLNKIAHSEGYNTLSPDLRNATLLKERVQNVAVFPNDYYANIAQVKKGELQRTLSGMGSPADKNRWLIDAFEVNGNYVHSSNSIQIPAAILQPPLYDWSLPEYLNYGGIGAMIGHEISHAFDTSGSQYDGDGNVREWWTEGTKNAYVDKAFCFYIQFSAFTKTGPNGEKLYIDSMKTLGENLADAGGLHAAWTTYKKSSQASPNANLLLPGFETLTPDQLFFVGFGQSHCDKFTPRAVATLIENDSHAPGDVRVLGTLQNNIDFSQAFNCPIGSPMNPEDKCQIW